MRIAAIAFASIFAAALGFAQPGFAQQNQNQSNQNGDTQSGPGMQGQGPRGPNGPGPNWRSNENWRNAQGDQDDEYWRPGWRRGPRWGMEDRMGPMWRMHRRMERMEEANAAAHFRFRRGQAAIDVKCPEGESLQACVNAAGQLLDKIANLRSSNAAGTTNGSGQESQDKTNSPSGAGMTNEPQNQQGDTENGQ